MLVLKRISQTAECTRGVLLAANEPICLTLENPWLNNEPNVSCIPDGEYEIGPVNSPHFGHVYEIKNVPGRSHILLHKGNIERDTEGCVLLGSSFGTLAMQPAVLGSKAAFDKFMRFMASNPKGRIKVVTV